jgi:hypothetical protein
VLSDIRYFTVILIETSLAVDRCSTEIAICCIETSYLSVQVGEVLMAVMRGTAAQLESGSFHRTSASRGAARGACVAPARRPVMCMWLPSLCSPPPKATALIRRNYVVKCARDRLAGILSATPLGGSGPVVEDVACMPVGKLGSEETKKQ